MFEIAVTNSPLLYSFTRLYVETEKGEQKWEKMLVEVPNPYYDMGMGYTLKKIPRIFTMLGGARTNAKRDLANQVLRDWQVAVRKKKKVDEKKVCPFYSPSTQNLELRTFMAKLKDQYSFQYVLKDFVGFEGSLGGVMAAVYKQRYEEWV